MTGAGRKDLLLSWQKWVGKAKEGLSMTKLWKLTKANIRKCPGTSLALFFVILVAVIFLNSGLITFLNFSKAFDRKADMLHSAHVMIAAYQRYYTEEYDDFISAYEGVTEMEKEDMLYLWSVKFKYGTGEFLNRAIFLLAEDGDISKLSFVGERRKTDLPGIYVSYILHTGGGYELGDDFVIEYKGKEYCFQIAGFTEDIHLGSINLGCIGFHLPLESYTWFREELNHDNVEGILLKARLKDSDYSLDMVADFNKSILSSGPTGRTTTTWLSSYTIAKNTRTATANIGAAIVICFSLIITIVSVIIMRYRINTTLEDSIVEIGILKAMGYTTKTLLLSILLQYGMIALLGATAGIGASFLLMDVLSDMFSAQTGIIWVQGFDLVACLISLLFTVSNVFIILPVSTIRLRRLSPMNAFRNGIYEYALGHNHCPLIKLKGRLDFTLAMKSMLSNLKRNLRITLVIAAISFTCVFAVIVYYNITANNKAFLDMIGSEICSLTAIVDSDNDTVSLGEEISTLEEVEKVAFYNYVSVNINHEICQIMVVDDYSLLNTNQIYQGSYPSNGNEVAISGFMAERFQKTIGDSLQLQLGNYKAEFIITGLLQSISNIGMNLSINYEGICRILPEYKFHNINIYLSNDSNINRFQERLITEYGSSLSDIINVQELTASQLGIYVLIVSFVAALILFIAAIVVSLTLYLIIKALIHQKKIEYGIQKAIGYTSLQLMTQTSLSFIPIVAVGTIAGSIAGGIYINPMISTLFRGIGVMKADFAIPYVWIILTGVGICVLAFLVSMLFSLRIRKITAYLLIEE